MFNAKLMYSKIKKDKHMKKCDKNAFVCVYRIIGRKTYNYFACDNASRHSQHFRHLAKTSYLPVLKQYKAEDARLIQGHKTVRFVSTLLAFCDLKSTTLPLCHCAFNSEMKSKPFTQQAHNLKTMSYQRQCDVMTSHRRRYDVVLTSYTCWVVTLLRHLHSVTEPHTSSSLSSLIGSSDFDERIRNIMEDVYADMPKTVSFKSSYHQVLILYSLFFLKMGCKIYYYT